MTTLPARRPARKTVRTCNVRPVDPIVAECMWTLTITVDGETKEYDLERRGSNEGDCFRLTTRVGHPEELAPQYEVTLSDTGHQCRETTPGAARVHHYNRLGTCKHIDCLVKLRDERRL